MGVLLKGKILQLRKRMEISRINKKKTRRRVQDRWFRVAYIVCRGQIDQFLVRE
jgi:hypothetical protein